ncbi:hypothetical protein ACWGQ5_33325 [Streptomyces sp. NPDC055722]
MGHTVSALLTKPPRRVWQRLRTCRGIKGNRHYDRAMIEITSDDTPASHQAGHSFLLVRRLRYTRELSFYRCHSAMPAALAGLVAVVCTRWQIEEHCRAAKSLTALDQGQMTSLLAVTLTRSRSAAPHPETELIPLTRPELLVVRRATALPNPCRDLTHILRWSEWRHHQHRAATGHRRWNDTAATTTT